MHSRSLFKKLLGWKDVTIRAVDVENGEVVVDVRPRLPSALCSRCIQRRRVYDRLAPRSWRHLDLAGVKWTVRYALRRVSCGEHGVVVEAVPWADVSAWHTRVFEDHVGYLAQQLSKTAIEKLMRIGWRTVGTIIERVMARHQPADRLEGLTHIGVDELSLNGRDYITLVYDHTRRGVVWSGRGKSKETLKAFFEALGAERTAKLQIITMDMAAAYVQGVREAAPHAIVVFDRFHVQRLAHDALDELRRDEVRDAGGARANPGLKGLRWPLQRNPWNLRLDESKRLASLPALNRRLYRGYLIKEALAGILDGRQWRVAERRLREWISWALRSQLQPFQRLARTIRGHFEGILAYIRFGMSNGMAEGLNGKIRVVTKRAYGFHSADALIAMIFLCCSGLHLAPHHRVIPSDELAS